MSTTPLTRPALCPRREAVIAEHPGLTDDDTSHLAIVSRTTWSTHELVLAWSDDYDVAFAAERTLTPAVPGESFAVIEWNREAPVYASGQPVNAAAKLDVVNGTYSVICWLTGTPAHVPPARPAQP